MEMPTNSAVADAVRANVMTTRPFAIKHIGRETEDTFTLEIIPRDGNQEFPFTPGQFNMLYVFGVGEVPISISGDPTKTRTLIHTTRAVGQVTKAMCALKPGDVLGVRGPYGIGWPVHEAEGQDVVVVAGGIGLAPLRPVIYHLSAHREKYGKVVLMYGARRPEELLYIKDLEKWRARFDFETTLTVDRATGSWKGNVGVVTTLIGRAAFESQSCIAMICGPEIMMRFTIPELKKRGVSDDRMYVSMERNMKCGIGMCGHCQVGTSFVCKDGPVYRCDKICDILTKREM
jgi:NAD(P)H-flavin reductase